MKPPGREPDGRVVLRIRDGEIVCHALHQVAAVWRPFAGSARTYCGACGGWLDVPQGEKRHKRVPARNARIVSWD